MKSLHLTIMAFCHIVLASLIFYFATSLANASPVVPALQQPIEQQNSQQASPVVLEPTKPVIANAQPIEQPKAVVAPAPVVEQSSVRQAPAVSVKQHEPALVSIGSQPAPKLLVEDKQVVVAAPVVDIQPPVVVKEKAQEVSLVEKKEPVVVDAKQNKNLEAKKAPEAEEKPVAGQATKQEVIPKPAALLAASPTQAQAEPVAVQQVKQSVQPKSDVAAQPVAQNQVVKSDQQVIANASPAEQQQQQQQVAVAQPSKVVVIEQVAAPQQESGTLKAKSSGETPLAPVPKPSPVVNGGLGPLHLLATTLCSYQPDRPVADDSINQLYARRALVRKSLFDFMSLKFTNLEKLSSRLGVGLQVVPEQKIDAPVAQSNSGKPSHGWPVVGKCTAHDLKLMGEAAWCECREEDEECAKAQVAAPSPLASPAMVASGEQSYNKDAPLKPKSARSIDTIDSFSPEQSSVISKILRVGDVKDAPVVESNFYNLNLTQHQLATLEAQATSTQECRRNALRFSKALFQHLAEDQQSRSESWPKLYAQISADDCARKRTIDIINALSSFRTDTTSIRRDNVEFAFAMDDLRTKVLENEVNVPLTFDRHFIEVEQFLQQSVRLMLSSVQPKRAKLTTMRYRSLMYGASANFDEQQQCIDIHQRLLAKNYPSDCNPTQFGQLPDVLRMTANSLELWSIEKELSLHLAKFADYPNITPVGQQKVKEDVNECIANLVAS